MEPALQLTLVVEPALQLVQSVEAALLLTLWVELVLWYIFSSAGNFYTKDFSFLHHRVLCIFLY